MGVSIRKVGGSAIVAIPKQLLEKLNLKIGDQLEPTIKDNCITLEPAKNIDNLIDAITPENLHESMDFGNAVGKESL